MKKELLPPKSDIIFKLIFGDANNKDVLAGFLKSVLNLPEDEYLEPTVVNPQLEREAPDDKLGIVDVRLHTKSGKTVQVEIQLSYYREMRERILFYYVGNNAVFCLGVMTK